MSEKTIPVKQTFHFSKTLE